MEITAKHIPSLKKALLDQARDFERMAQSAEAAAKANKAAAETLFSAAQNQIQQASDYRITAENCRENAGNL